MMNDKQDRESISQLSPEELSTSIEALRRELFQQRMAVLTMEDNNTSKIKFIRKQIARRIHRVAQLQTAELKQHA
jgi:ribosomal protein L29